MSEPEERDGDSPIAALPEWCDLGCPHAEFPKDTGVDGSGSCRTFLALWCSRLGRLVTKNSPCAARREPQGTP